ncbi:hypothetical protein F441_10673 [Phytophthora nicotianae CJ01A1]|uniref:Uncharacterized protein n=5 Tax=Phytophthora nicotianae TaxID=4792 RepID=W2Q3X7_PHYN3|nr:hypothetical protein PPTG_23095 [Phytophthora nicotianae INRA-310]ETI44565.1 hypothetical protein F443_10738 [Phytophthora nicotianae P1569]ETO59006.1 hypothetical protein F444_22616 [Phytophthora nicotianae P1976]ETP14386.1 hypothetical protein F441_10673 [Phytophthora nicotianae CJ01A1]ETP42448.1 hypothetical protein F442_10639 [Phytophthora nicotianae P10297]ETN07888.1 hypothetical protein PPTG_23095 [Phytophthora nicotianae INRA-310]
MNRSLRYAMVVIVGAHAKTMETITEWKTRQ